MDQTLVNKTLQDCTVFEESQNVSRFFGDEIDFGEALATSLPCVSMIKGGLEAIAINTPKLPLVSEFFAQCLEVEEQPFGIFIPSSPKVVDALDTAESPCIHDKFYSSTYGNEFTCKSKNEADTEAVLPMPTSLSEVTEISLRASTMGQAVDKKNARLINDASDFSSKVLLQTKAFACDNEIPAQSLSGRDVEIDQLSRDAFNEEKNMEYTEISTNETLETNGPYKEWYSGFNLQLGQHGRKAFLNLIRSTYRKSPEHCGIVLDNYSPRSSISRLPYFNIKDLWELCWRFNKLIPGVWEKAIRIHDEYGKSQTKRSLSSQRSPCQSSKFQKLDNFDNTTPMSSSDSRYTFMDVFQTEPHPQFEPTHSFPLTSQAQVELEGDYETSTPIRNHQKSPLSVSPVSTSGSHLSVSSRATTAQSASQSPQHKLLKICSRKWKEREKFFLNPSAVDFEELSCCASSSSPYISSVPDTTISTPTKMLNKVLPAAHPYEKKYHETIPTPPVHLCVPSCKIYPKHGKDISVTKNGNLDFMKRPAVELKFSSCVLSNNGKSRSGRKITKPLRFQESANSLNQMPQRFIFPALVTNSYDVHACSTSEELINKPSEIKQTCCPVDAANCGDHQCLSVNSRDCGTQHSLQLLALPLESTSSKIIHSFGDEKESNTVKFTNHAMTRTLEKLCCTVVKSEVEKPVQLHVNSNEDIEQVGNASTHDECYSISEDAIPPRSLSLGDLSCKLLQSEKIVDPPLLVDKQEVVIQAYIPHDEIDNSVDNAVLGVENSNVEITRIESSEQLFELAVQNKGLTIVDMSNYLPSSCYSKVLILQCSGPFQMKKTENEGMQIK